MMKKSTILALAFYLPCASNAAIVSLAPNTAYDANTADMDLALGLDAYTIEDFEDVNLVPGLSIEYISPDNGPITMLSQTYTDGSGSFSNNSWDGNKALVNTFDNDIWFGGPNGDVRGKIAQRVIFNVGSVDFFGVGLGNFQAEIADHAVLINGVEVVSAIESLADFTSGINIRNGYLMIEAMSGEAINSVAIELRFNNTSTPIENGVQGDGLIFDHLAIGDRVPAVPVPAAVWLFGTALLGLLGISRRRAKAT